MCKVYFTLTDYANYNIPWYSSEAAYSYDFSTRIEKNSIFLMLNLSIIDEILISTKSSRNSQWMRDYSWISIKKRQINTKIKTTWMLSFKWYLLYCHVLSILGVKFHDVCECITVHRNISHSVASVASVLLACLLAYPAPGRFLRKDSAFQRIRIRDFRPYTSYKNGLSSLSRLDSGDFISRCQPTRSGEATLSAWYYDNTLIFICNRVFDLGW